eukprot:2693516-Prymnesium_polylepis.1
MMSTARAHHARGLTDAVSTQPSAPTAWRSCASSALRVCPLAHLVRQSAAAPSLLHTSGRSPLEAPSRSSSTPRR